VKQKSANEGISLIILIITIIIIIIIAGAVILALNNTNIIEKAKGAVFTSNISAYKSQLNQYISDQSLNSLGDNSLDNINANTYSEIKAIINNIKEADAKNIRIVKGQLTYIGNDSNEIELAKSVGISLTPPYVKDGLILWYDGIYNGGIGIHNDNTSANKGIWKDLIGSNDGTLQNFNYNSSNGWLKNSLKFDRKPNTVTFNLDISDKHTVEFIVMTRGTGYNGIFTVANNTAKTYSTGTAFKNFLFYNTCPSGGGNNYIGSAIDYTKQSLFTMTFDGTTITRNLYQNNVQKYLSYSGGGVSGDFYGYNSFLLGNCNWGALLGEIYSVRVYNRILTAAERTQNYEIDKVRYDI